MNPVFTEPNADFPNNLAPEIIASSSSVPSEAPAVTIIHPSSANSEFEAEISHS